MGTLCPRSTSHHKWLGVLFISYPPGILTCEKQTLYRGFLLGFYYFRKEAGSRTALSHHFKFLLFLLAFDLVLGMIDCFFQWNQIWTPFLPSQPPPQCFSQQEGMRTHFCQKLVHKFPSSKMHSCISSLNSTLSPEKCQTRKKNLLSLLFDLSSIVSKAIPTKMPYRKNNHSQEKEQSSNIFLMCWIFTNSLSDCTLTPNLCWAGWSDPQRCSPGSGTVTQQKCTGLGFLPSLLSDPEHTL